MSGATQLIEAKKAWNFDNGKQAKTKIQDKPKNQTTIQTQSIENHKKYRDPRGVNEKWGRKHIMSD